MSTTAKKRLKAPKKRVLNDNNFDDSWAILSKAFTEIHNKNASELSFEVLYRNAYTLVLHKDGEKLYNAAKEVVAAHLTQVAGGVVYAAYQDLVNAPGTRDYEKQDAGVRFLKVVRDAWEDHTLCMKMIRDVLMYLDRIYVKQANVPPIYDTGLILFRTEVVESPELRIGQHLISTILAHITLERQSYSIDRTAIKTNLEMLQQLSTDNKDTVYGQSFEPLFIGESSKFYERESNEMLLESDAATYLRHVEKRLQEEYERSQHYLSPSSEPKIRKIVEKELIESHMKAVAEMDSGLRHMVTHDKIDDLTRIFQLFSRVDSDHRILTWGVTAHIQSIGKEINAGLVSQPTTTTVSIKGKEPSGSAPPPTNTAEATLSAALKWVELVLELKIKYDNILKEAFSKEPKMKSCVVEGFSSFINANPKTPEFVSLFIDENLKKGIKGKSEAETDMVLDNATVLFRYIKDKDVFERYYKSHLAKRLLQGRSVSDDAERGMLAKLRLVAGYAFTTKLEGMFKDMKTSRDIMVDYKKHLSQSRTHDDKSLELLVSVLTSTYWPLSFSAAGGIGKCVFPPVVEKAKSSFTQFYLGRHQGRQLSWHGGMGNADIRVTFKSRKHDLNVSTYAMVILMLFNAVDDTESLSFKDIENATSIPPNELKRHLQSLACAKFKILTKYPKGREVAETDRFSFNANFQSNLARIKIMTVAAVKVETTEERKDTMEKIEESRKHQTEAAIVRIMKQRKTLDHNNLIAEVTAQLSSRFNPAPNMIKARIEGLIEREYLERDESNMKVYKYMA